jgi:hypothetical protein
MGTDSNDALARALHANGPAAEHAQELALSGFLVGRWQADAICILRWATHVACPERFTPFHWLGEIALPGTQQWRLQLEFHARRIGGK